MCGIIGLFEIKDKETMRQEALKMVRKIRHRGPDWSGSYSDENCVLMHERLSIVDVEHGGRVDGMAKNITSLLDSIPEDATIIPGHGPIGTKKELIEFRDMLDGTYAEVKAMIDTGLDLEAIQSKGLSDRWDSWSGFIPEDKWIGLVFASIQADA